ncbi:hypothetical protein WJX72_001100 [[Myrmecia] bisecta]|uniref:Calponin-homology (CH) domain-containing protein n=1 Tax=[Myrmecia] bisecta TaxID=41462 RepID=A0AAW1Q5W6_9CHLO
MDVESDELQALYTWVDEIPLSRPKKNIARDFADGVLAAEIVQHFFPKLVELHNYSSANGLAQKLYNWNTLNQKVFKRLGFVVAKSECESVANCEPGAVERVLKLLKVRITGFLDDKTRRPSSTDSDSPTAHDGHRHGSFGLTSGSHFLHPTTSSQHANAAAGAFANISLKSGGSGDKATAVMMADKEQTILELRETNEILETKVRKLEQLVRLKDAKIQTMLAKMQAAGLA